MKRGKYGFIVMSVIVILSACGSTGQLNNGENITDGVTEKEAVTNDIFGTWEFDHAKIDGSDYAKEELEAMDDGTLTDFIGLRIIIKEGGGAYLDTDNEQMTTNWTENDDGTISIGYMDCKKEDKLLEYNTYADNYIYFVKVSDSQTVTERESEKGDVEEGGDTSCASPDNYFAGMENNASIETPST